MYFLGNMFGRFCERGRKNADLGGPRSTCQGAAGVAVGSGCRRFPTRMVHFLEKVTALFERGRKNTRAMLAFLAFPGRIVKNM